MYICIYFALRFYKLGICFTVSHIYVCILDTLIFLLVLFESKLSAYRQSLPRDYETMYSTNLRLKVFRKVDSALNMSRFFSCSLSNITTLCIALISNHLEAILKI